MQDKFKQARFDTDVFDADALVANAIEQSGFSNFGSMPYREGLEKLLETYDRHVTDPMGREQCSERVLNLLITRLKCEHAFKTIPEINAQKITAPIFVTGLPRSGTSALLNLLAAAAHNRGALLWEMQFPDPWPGSKPGDEDPRYRPLVEELESARDAEFAKIHFADADTPEECIMLHNIALQGPQLGFEIMLEPYRSWLLAQDPEPVYAYQKKLLQMLNWRNPGKQWLLKTPAHMWGIDAIVKVFPDARFIWCHRNPQAVVPSINSLTRAVLTMYAGHCSELDMQAFGLRVMEWYAQSLEKGLAERAKLPAHLFIDCSQQELVEQPMKLVDKVYRAFNLPLSDEARATMQAHINANPKDKHGRHEYDLAAFGLTRDLIDKRFAFYTRDTHWPISD